MRFSVFQYPSSCDPAGDAQTIDDAVDLALWADESGFAGIFLPEHHVSPLGVAGDSLTFASYLAPQLRQAYLGLSIVVVPYHHPVRMVERFNLLDQLTAGKVLVGIGSGNGVVQEAVGLGIDPRDALEGMTEEHLEIAFSLWAKQPDDPPVSFKTKYYEGTVVERVVPSSYTKPHPKLMAVAQREASIQRAARRGWPVMLTSGDEAGGRLEAYREVLAAAGHPRDVLDHCMKWSTVAFFSCIVSETDAEAERQLKIALEEMGHRRTWTERQRARAYAFTDNPDPAATEPRQLPDFASPAALSKPFYLVGSPDTVAAKLERYAALEVGNVMMNFREGLGAPSNPDVVRNSMRLFADEVMPRFAARQPVKDSPLVPPEEAACAHIGQAGQTSFAKVDA